MTYEQSLRTRARLSHAIKYLARDVQARAIVCLALAAVNKEHSRLFQDTNWQRRHWCGKCYKYNAAGLERAA
jgi:hypothetical protein